MVKKERRADWERIESAAGVAFQPAFREYIVVAVQDMIYGPPWPTRGEEERDRALFRRLARTCSEASKAIREYQELNKDMRPLVAPWKVDPKFAAKEWLAYWEAEKAVMSRSLAKKIASIAAWAKRDGNRVFLAREKGRPRDHVLQGVIEGLYAVFRAAGGQGAAYYSEYEKGYKGRFLAMVKEILRQLE